MLTTRQAWVGLIWRPVTSLRSFPPSSPSSIHFWHVRRNFRMAATTQMINAASKLEEVTERTKLFKDMKIDILTSTHEADNDAARHAVSRTFTSDTLTVPTPDMQAYAFKCSLGDDVYHDPSTRALEAAIARLTGKEAALYMPSGTMSNQIGIRSLLGQPPYSILCDARAHVHKYEAGGLSFHSGAAVLPVQAQNGHHLTLEDVVENAILSEDVHYAPTRVIALENTLNGTIFPQADILAIAEFARSEGIFMHLDGARIWHVAAEMSIPLSTLCDPFDTVSLCFSKGLGAPVGSCLVGSNDVIGRAKKFRKLFGGGMRQVGSLSGAAAYAVTHNVPLLPKVHELTRKLEKGLEDAGCEITSRAETCMVFFDPTPAGIQLASLVARAESLPDPIYFTASRLVCHIQTSPAAVDDLLSLVRTMAEEAKAEGFVPLSAEEREEAKLKELLQGGRRAKDVFIRLGRNLVNSEKTY